ncbi:hypothetical protein GMDG_01206 [Pseudogymnoascus destructans 20631-21]|uniref:Cytochrome c oxidase subunit 13, mitochondrial n=1 Tax=Pseudogymnoascus destructans (strain ATCC MYA-4855 / 20631-21) TaxID=658429 RepID=L8FRX7_PSED2|nr:hypothetical protein GMDG_01206 [Pseudogymnoascus destructans 20631-21]
MFSSRSIVRAAAPLRSQTVRQAIQKRLAHAEAKLPAGVQDNAFNRERQAVKDHAAATSDLWRKLSIYAVIPCLIISGVNAYNLWNEHWEHWAHREPLEERPEYPYQNVRSKNYFWGNGDKTLFWNDAVNYHKPAE